ncbi:MAG: hypothetical protein ACOCG5_08880 [Candidatus Alkaliphilus sp. MAG34]
MEEISKGLSRIERNNPGGTRQMSKVKIVGKAPLGTEIYIDGDING